MSKEDRKKAEKEEERKKQGRLNQRKYRHREKTNKVMAAQVRILEF